VAELSLELDRVVPRYALWTALREYGHDPEFLSRDAALAFCDGPLDRFLGELGLALGARRTRRLRRRVARFDPLYPAPEEVFARF
jgi:hypothetical protein